MCVYEYSSPHTLIDDLNYGSVREAAAVLIAHRAAIGANVRLRDVFQFQIALNASLH